MILASILITTDAHQDQPLPPTVCENIDSFRHAHPGMTHRLFRGPQIREYLAQHHGQEVLAAYDGLKPFAYKSDLARYCILLREGGVYADLSMYFLRGWRLDDTKLGVFRDFAFAAPWQTANGLFFAPPGHKALAKAIELILANVKDRYFGSSMLCPTGPVLFGKAIALTCEPDDVIFGHSVMAPAPASPTVPLTVPSHCLVYGGAMVAASRKPGGGPLTALGVAGGNEYVALWQNRDVYAGG